MITPLPVQTKLENNALRLFGYNISDDIAQVLGAKLATYEDFTEEVKYLQLNENGLKDKSFAHILRGL